MSDHSETPTFRGATAWLNSEPLESADLRGKVVLADFWTLTCINWLRTEPYIRGWANAYRDDGLVVVGVHTPEFAFEHDLERIRMATKRFSIDYPVAVDNDYGVWTEFENHYWPALYLMDQEGVVRHHQFGEGGYEQAEQWIQRLLGIDRPLLQVQGTGIEAEADWNTLRTGETYLGDLRAERVAQLKGEWSRFPEFVELAEAGGSISMDFESRDVHMVMSPGSQASIPFTVLLDGIPPRDSHGGDIDADGRGLLDEGRVYQLIRVSSEVRPRTVEVVFDAAGAEGYSLTFG